MLNIRLTIADPDGVVLVTGTLEEYIIITKEEAAEEHLTLTEEEAQDMALETMAADARSLVKSWATKGGTE